MIAYLPPGLRPYFFIVIDLAILAFLVAIGVAAGITYALHEWTLALPATGLPRSIFVTRCDRTASLLMTVHLTAQIFTKCQELRATRSTE